MDRKLFLKILFTGLVSVRIAVDCGAKSLGRYYREFQVDGWTIKTFGPHYDQLSEIPCISSEIKRVLWDTRTKTITQLE